MSSTIAQFDATHGPVSEVPEDYVPEVLISDHEFEKIFNNRNAVTNEELFHARDYVVDQFHQCAEIACNDGYPSTQSVLEMFSLERLEALFWGLESCSCCVRHCHNTPIAVNSEENASILDVVTEEMVFKRDCHCHCRMAMRMIRRAYMSAK
jgi:hypothetical protein